MRRYRVMISRSERESAVVEVGAWEVDVLRAVHGPSNVSVGEVVTDRQPYPDPVGEFDRLCRRYGSDRENGGAPYAQQVYGGLGADRIRQLIEDEIASEGGKVKQRIAPAPPSEMIPVIRRGGKNVKAKADSGPTEIAE